MPGDLVDDDDFDLAAIDETHQLLEARTVDVAAGESAIVEVIRDEHPAFVGLGSYVAFSSLALRLEGVERLLEPLLGALAGVDRAPQDLLGWLGLNHRLPPTCVL